MHSIPLTTLVSLSQDQVRGAGAGEAAGPAGGRQWKGDEDKQAAEEGALYAIPEHLQVKENTEDEGQTAWTTGISRGPAACRVSALCTVQCERERCTVLSWP